MTLDEFRELTAWMLPRWSEMAAWTEEQIAALYADLQPWPGPEVRAAVERCWEDGREYAPKGGAISSVLRDRGVRKIGSYISGDVRREEAAVPWSAVAEDLGVPGMSFTEYVTRGDNDG